MGPLLKSAHIYSNAQYSLTTSPPQSCTICSTCTCTLQLKPYGVGTSSVMNYSTCTCTLQLNPYGIPTSSVMQLHVEFYTTKVILPCFQTKQFCFLITGAYPASFPSFSVSESSWSSGTPQPRDGGTWRRRAEHGLYNNLVPRLPLTCTPKQKKNGKREFCISPAEEVRQCHVQKSTSNMTSKNIK